MSPLEYLQLKGLLKDLDRRQKIHEDRIQIAPLSQLSQLKAV